MPLDVQECLLMFLAMTVDRPFLLGHRTLLSTIKMAPCLTVWKEVGTTSAHSSSRALELTFKCYYAALASGTWIIYPLSSSEDFGFHYLPQNTNTVLQGTDHS